MELQQTAAPPPECVQANANTYAPASLAAVARTRGVSAGHSGVGGAMTFLSVRKKVQTAEISSGIKAALFAVGMHFIPMWLQQFKPLNDSHVNGELIFRWRKYSPPPTPVCDLQGVPGWRPTDRARRSAAFSRDAGTKELSQQPSSDFGCGASQMQKRSLLVLIFPG